jgi:predicted TIM-barrel fold metal-dependent hydrolase
MAPSTQNIAPDLTTAISLLISSAYLLDDGSTSTKAVVRVPSPDGMNTPFLIACVESYITSTIPVGTSILNDPTAPALHLLPSTTLSKLKNIGPARVRDLRSLGHSKQILSHIPIDATSSSCTKLNDMLSTAVRMNADKFAALATLPATGNEAARELQRCVTKLGFVGGVVALRPDRNYSYSLGSGLEEVWSIAENYRVPIMLRDMWPTGEKVPTSPCLDEQDHGTNVHVQLPVYQAELADSVLAPLVTHLHTSHNHTPLPIIHLYLSSVFDRHPNLRLVLANPCLLPSILPRIETILAHIPPSNKPKRGFLDVWQNNFFFTTADVLDMSTMRTLLEQIPIDRVLYASNYPLEERGRELMDELKESGFLSKDEWERVAWRNALSLFGLQSTTGKGKIRS